MVGVSFACFFAWVFPVGWQEIVYFAGWVRADFLQNIPEVLKRVDSGSTALYAYDFAGRRIYKNVSSVETVFVYDGGHVIAEHMDLDTGDEPDDLARRYIYGPGIDRPVAMIDFTGVGAVWYYYHQDALGNVVALSNNVGNLVESYEYTPFGGVTMYDASGVVINTSAVDNPYMFTGRRYDDETGLYYYRARAYSPDLGRFLQTDPIGYADSMNLYRYCGNNPVNWVDPWGLDPLSGRGALVAGGYSTAEEALIATLKALHPWAAKALLFIGVYKVSEAAYEEIFDEDDDDEDDSDGNGKDECGNNENRNPAQDKQLGKDEIKRLEEGGEHPHKLKPKKNASKYDLYKDTDGNIYVKPKGGKGPGDPTGLNIKDF